MRIPFLIHCSMALFMLCQYYYWWCSMAEMVSWGWSLLSRIVVSKPLKAFKSLKLWGVEYYLSRNTLVSEPEYWMLVTGQLGWLKPTQQQQQKEIKSWGNHLGCCPLLVCSLKILSIVFVNITGNLCWSPTEKWSHLTCHNTLYELSCGTWLWELGPYQT